MLRSLCVLVSFIVIASICLCSDLLDFGHVLGIADLQGVNLANALEAPKEGQWGVIIQEDYFDIIKNAGFNFVRIPVAFSEHADHSARFDVSEVFLSRIDEVLGWATKRHLAILLSFHSFEELYRAPEFHAEQFIAIWEQIANRYYLRYPNLYFELLNEPHGKMSADIWNDILNKVVIRIRQIDPGRLLVLGGIDYSSPQALRDMVFPDGITNLVATFHYYRPYEFTHQGAEWADGSGEWLGRKWSGSEEEIDAVRKDFAEAAQWSRETGIPVLLGEFGSIAKADRESRVRWTKTVREQAEYHGFGWAVWEFCAHFAVFDGNDAKFDPEIMSALMPQK